MFSAFSSLGKAVAVVTGISFLVRVAQQPVVATVMLSAVAEGKLVAAAAVMLLAAVERKSAVEEMLLAVAETA